MDQFLLYGDSITQISFSQDFDFSAGAALSDAYARKLDVVNRGLSGYNTDQALALLPCIIPNPEKARVRLLTIFFGANDARLPNTLGGPQQNVPVERYMENLRRMVQHECLQKHDGIKMMLITPPPIDERKVVQLDREKYPELGANSPPCRTAASSLRYAKAVLTVGQECNVPVLDLWSAMISRAGCNTSGPDEHRQIPGSLGVPANEKLQGFLYDGLHLSGAGYRVLFEETMALIERTWPDHMPDNLPFALPTWNDEETWVANWRKRGEGLM